MEAISAIRAYRIRREIEAEIERLSVQGSDIAMGMVHGLMKARVLLMTDAEAAESWHARREMFG